MAEHGDVVSAVAESHCLGKWYVFVGKNVVYSDALVYFFVYDIDKEGMPTEGCAFRHECFHQVGLFVGGEK